MTASMPWRRPPRRQRKAPLPGRLPAGGLHVAGLPQLITSLTAASAPCRHRLERRHETPPFPLRRGTNLAGSAELLRPINFPPTASTPSGIPSRSTAQRRCPYSGGIRPTGDGRFLPCRSAERHEPARQREAPPTGRLQACPLAASTTRGSYARAACGKRKRPSHAMIQFRLN